MRQFFVYILAKHRHGALYVGVTNDLVCRIYEHREGLAPGFTKRHEIKQLVYFELHPTAMSAIQREKTIKHWSRAWMIRTIEKLNPTWKDLYEDIGGLALLDPRDKPGGDDRVCRGTVEGAETQIIAASHPRIRCGTPSPAVPPGPRTARRR